MSPPSMVLGVASLDDSSGGTNILITIIMNK
jgi:hypothetical protein